MQVVVQLLVSRCFYVADHHAGGGAVASLSCKSQTSDHSEAPGVVGCLVGFSMGGSAWGCGATTDPISTQSLASKEPSQILQDGLAPCNPVSLQSCNNACRR